MKKLIFYTCLLISVLATPGVSCFATEFKLVKRQGAISLYERWVKYHGNTVRELKADFTAATTGMGEVVALLKNQSLGRQWNVNAKNYNVAHTGDDQVWLTYIHYKMPWPMSDQDCCLRYSYKNEPAASTVNTIYFASTLHNKFPVTKSITRLTGTRGKWVVEKKRENLSKITYQVITDKNASVPRWISDPVVYDHLFNTLSQFKTLLES